MIRITFVALTLLALAPAVSPAQASRKFRFACDSASFAANASADDLARWFGPDNVTSEVIQLGEGFTDYATVLFANDPRRRLEVLWQDSVGRRFPSMVRISGAASAWTTPRGVTLGTRLRTLERLNGKPFRLAGFAFDASGSIRQWSDGRFARTPSEPCGLAGGVEPRVVRDSTDRRWYGQVIGARLFSSAHPAMQALDPIVDRLYLVYQPIPSTKRP